MEHFFKITQNVFSFIKFLYLILIYKCFQTNLKKQFSGNVAILANGPSLNEVIPHLIEFVNVDFVVLNYFAFDPVFLDIKPKHYCLADPTFFQDSPSVKNVEKLFSLFEHQVNWDINLYIPSVNYKRFLIFSKITNKNIKIIKVNTVDYSGFESFRNFFYSKGFSMPRPQNVAIFATFVALNLGYSRLLLYGFDHSFFDSISVNKKNQLCNKETHFYGNGTEVLKPLIRSDNNQPWKISDYLSAISIMFKSHDLLSNYSNYLNVQIINCTDCSLIDSYERIDSVN